MSRCPSCGHETQPGARYCSACGAVMEVGVAPPREERKVVTVVFADLVGFTSRSEQLDPEDVRAFLSPYYARLRTELERFGGTVEKFIGDAVMALFGAPVAHEDDPERAVRAALAIRDWVVEQDALQVRIAVNTGEALIALEARPGEGEGMASGDVVNTTARLQAGAPVNGVLAGEVTYRATSQVITYRDAEPVPAKGKAEPVPVWEAIEARSRFGVDASLKIRTRLVGRTHEVDVLTDALARVRRDRAAQLVTVVGVPGIGKSRLVAELFRHVSDDPGELIRWRQGRSLHYGDGVTFWALSEMVKAQAGILETDSAEQAEEKLQLAVTSLIADPGDAQWVTGHLRPLAGLSGGTTGGGDRQSEAFTAWRRFFEGLAEQHPLTLVFDDLHWADEHLLDFVEYLVDWASGVPLLVVCTARPELFERRPGWSGGKRNATTLSLSPLSEDETAQLISSLSDRPVMPLATQQALLARAGGNPLYAEQYVRMLAERPDADALPLPETVHGIIAARLDALSSEEKSLLQNAAVMGKVFWLGAVAAIGGLERPAVELQLHALERKDFIHRARRSSVANEAEFAFLHVLVRDVAYGQIPRARRADKHQLAAAWISALGRSEDHAEMLAHHYLSALELRSAAGLPLEPGFAEHALASLRDAGDRASSLNAYRTAAGFYESALKLAPARSPVRAHLLSDLAEARFHAGDLDPALLIAAIDALIGCDDREAAAEAEASLGEVFWVRGERDLAFEHLGRARELVEARRPSRAKAFVTASLSRFLMLAGEDENAIRLGREATGMAEQLGFDDLRASALNNVGVSRTHRGDSGGLGDLEQSIELATRVNARSEMCRSRNNLAALLWEQGDLMRAGALWDESAGLAERFGLVEFQRWLRGVAATKACALGRWHEGLARVDEFIAEVEAGSPHYHASWCYQARALVRLGRDDPTRALADAERGLEYARLAKDPQIVYQTVPVTAHVFRELGMARRASELVDEFLEHLRVTGSVGAAIEAVHMVAWTLTASGRGQELLDILPMQDSLWARAAEAFASGDVRGAADICASMGALPEEALDRLWLARTLVEQNRRREADVELQRALAFFRSVGATRYIRAGEALLAATA